MSTSNISPSQSSQRPQINIVPPEACAGAYRDTATPQSLLHNNINTLLLPKNSDTTLSGTCNTSPFSRAHEELVPMFFGRPSRRRAQTGPAAAPHYLQSQLDAIKAACQDTPIWAPPTSSSSVMVTLEPIQTAAYPLMLTSGAHTSGFLERRDRQSVRFKQRWIQVLHSMFQELARNNKYDKKRRTLDKETFLNYFPLPGVLGERLFDLFDTDKSNTVDFHEFFLGLSVIYNGTPKDRKKFLFDMYDLDGNGFITKAELISLLTHVPAALKILRNLTVERHNDRRYLKGDTAISQNEHHCITGMHDPLSKNSKFIDIVDRLGDIDRAVESLVDNIFANVDNNLPSPVQKESNTFESSPASRKHVSAEETDGLTFDEFCQAVDKSMELSEVFNLFFDLGMPDLPIPSDTLVPECLVSEKSSPSTFLCGGSGDLASKHTVRAPKPPSRTSNIPRNAGDGSANSRTTQNSPISHVTTTESLDETSTRKAGSFNPLEESPVAGFTTSESMNSSSTLQSASPRELLNSSSTQNSLQPTANPRDIVVSGWLYKNFKTTKSSTPKKAIFLQGAIVLPVCDTEKKKSSSAFDIQLPSGRVARLFARNKCDRDLWINTLIRASRTARFHDDYTIHELVGQGRFAVVHRASSKHSQATVAVKIIAKKDLDQNDSEFLRNEVAVLTLLQHPNIVRLLDVYDSTEFLYLVMEWVPGGDVYFFANRLDQHVCHDCFCNNWSSFSKHKDGNKRDCFTEKDNDLYNNDMKSYNGNDLLQFHSFVKVTKALVCERLALIVARGVLRGLNCLHRHNIVHRDLKPENILLVTPSSDADELVITPLTPLFTATKRMTSFLHPTTQSPSAPADRNEDHKNMFLSTVLTSPTTIKTDCSAANSILSCPCQSCAICKVLQSVMDVKVTDFGLAKILPPTREAHEALGTLSYAAPEIILERPYRSEVDIWALGVLTYQILSGGQKLPFTGVTEKELARNIVRCQYESDMNDHLGKLPAEARAFVQASLKPNPATRITAADALNHPWFLNRYLRVVGRE